MSTAPATLVTNMMTSAGSWRSASAVSLVRAGTIESNAAPYFVGVFDTVASLGAKGPLRIAFALLLLLLVAGIAGGVALLGRWLFDVSWIWAFGAGLVLVGLYALWSYLRTALKIMWPPMPGKRLPRMHLAQWSGKHFDRLISKSVKYARHAISIDENSRGLSKAGVGLGQRRHSACRG